MKFKGPEFSKVHTTSPIISHVLSPPEKRTISGAKKMKKWDLKWPVKRSEARVKNFRFPKEVIRPKKFPETLLWALTIT